MDHSVLVVDDEAHIRRILSLQLARAKIAVVCAADGEEALEVIEESVPDLVITDYQMPKKDGLTLCRELQSRPETAGIPVLLLTAKGFEFQEDVDLSCFNIVGILCKPFSPNELLETVERALGSRGTPP